MGSVNKWIGIGNLTRDPETRTTKEGKDVTNFAIACNEKWGGEDKVEYVNIVAWGKLAVICAEYLSKGKQVYIEGRLQQRVWEDKEGNQRYTTEIVVNSMVMLGGKDQSSNQRQGRDSKSPASNDDFDDSELPF
ncbi:Single-stranded DNA-binding protein [hydrothermal vent metagenome]|uniref:Single-stranded DNA-binding protein n=1 Tax=hydrothermal vent metagenome TaxID=652676 RepID=A0A3B0V5R1_9ZZZZ